MDFWVIGSTPCLGCGRVHQLYTEGQPVGPARTLRLIFDCPTTGVEGSTDVPPEKWGKIVYTRPRDGVLARTV